MKTSATMALIITMTCSGNVYPLYPTLIYCSKTRVCRGILSYFCSKTLWMLQTEAVLTCTHNLCFEPKKKKKKKKKKTAEKDYNNNKKNLYRKVEMMPTKATTRCTYTLPYFTLHGQVFVMSWFSYENRGYVVLMSMGHLSHFPKIQFYGIF